MSEIHETGCGCADCYEKVVAQLTRRESERKRQEDKRDEDGTPTLQDLEMMFDTRTLEEKEED